MNSLLSFFLSIEYWTISATFTATFTGVLLSHQLSISATKRQYKKEKHDESSQKLIIQLRKVSLVMIYTDTTSASKMNAQKSLYDILNIVVENRIFMDENIVEACYSLVEECLPLLDDGDTGEIRSKLDMLYNDLCNTTA